VWEQQPNSLRLLKSITQHRAVGFLQDVRTNVDTGRRINTYDVRIERRVMNRAKPEAVWNNRFTLRMPVRQNVRSVEKFHMAQVADTALPTIRGQDQSAKPLLVQALEDGARGVLST